MQIATWNVNSIRARLVQVKEWLARESPDVLCLQETKVADDAFPLEPLEDEGYNVTIFGQKAYNGVAILSKTPIEEVITGFPDDKPTDQKRVIGCIVEGVMLLNLYVVNGQEVGSEKYAFKLEWLKKVRALLDEHFVPSEKVVVTGDFNITFDDRDVYDPEGWRDKILCSKPERDALRHIMDFGLHDAYRKFHEEGAHYTWWHYRAGGFPKNHGLRIDHFLMSDAALEACTEVVIHRDVRGQKGASDHAPVVAKLDLATPGA